MKIKFYTLKYAEGTREAVVGTPYMGVMNMSSIPDF
jgi:hypothetical protein